MTKALVFDMDGTIVDLYGVKNWEYELDHFNESPYMVAKPLFDMEKLNSILLKLKKAGFRVIVTSWLAKPKRKSDLTHWYNNKVRKAKINWLNKYNFPYDEIHFVKYGTTKADCTRKLGGFQILIDDNEKIRRGWHLGATIDATENMLIKLADLFIDI